MYLIQYLVINANDKSNALAIVAVSRQIIYLFLFKSFSCIEFSLKK